MSKKISAKIKLAKINWPNILKSWDLTKKLKTDFSLPLQDKNKIKIKTTGNISWQIFRFDQAPLKLQKKYLTSQQDFTWSSQAIFSMIKNHWLVDIKIFGDGELFWQMDSADLGGIYFFVQGQGEITINEKQNRSVCQLVMIDVGNLVTLHYSLNKQQIKGFTFLSYQARLGKQSNCFWEIGLKNKAWLVGSFVTKLLGTGSQNNYLFGGRISGQSKTYLNFLNQHLVPNTTGDMLIKAIAEDKSQTIIAGLIDIGLKSTNANSYLQEDILLLSAQARASALPNLEILNRDVKASHGATVGRIDEEMLYYLMSRGLSKMVATELIVSGFFHSLGSKITDRQRQRKLFNLLLAKDISK